MPTTKERVKRAAMPTNLEKKQRRRTADVIPRPPWFDKWDVQSQRSGRTLLEVPSSPGFVSRPQIAGPSRLGAVQREEVVESAQGSVASEGETSGEEEENMDISRLRIGSFQEASDPGYPPRGQEVKVCQSMAFAHYQLLRDMLDILVGRPLAEGCDAAMRDAHTRVESDRSISVKLIADVDDLRKTKAGKEQVDVLSGRLLDQWRKTGHWSH